MSYTDTTIRGVLKELGMQDAQVERVLQQANKNFMRKLHTVRPDRPLEVMVAQAFVIDALDHQTGTDFSKAFIEAMNENERLAYGAYIIKLMNRQDEVKKAGELFAVVNQLLLKFGEAMINVFGR